MTVRRAVPTDIPRILELVHALAVYEREPDAVENTTEMLHERLFGDDPKVFAHVATSSHDAANGEVVGIAVWFVTYSTWTGRHGIWLEDLFVDPDHRGGGHGKALLAALAQECLDQGYPRLEWTVLDWNEPAIGFYRSISAVGMEEWTTQRLTGDALAELAAP